VLLPVLAGWSASFVLCLLLVVTKTWHGAVSMDGVSGIQKVHVAPTPRIGGIPVVAGLCLAVWLAPVGIQPVLFLILLAGMPAFVLGIAEDLSKQVSVLLRLLATMASGLFAWHLSGYAITRVNIPGLDYFLSLPPLSVLFTAFAVGGVANAINIIDGFNGLASTTTVLAFLGYAGIAWQCGDLPLTGAALVLSACVGGFFWVNWPFGKLFLGDGGSYFVGFALAWVAVMLMARHPGVSAFGVLLVCVHPVTEVLFSIYRRKMRHQPPGQPDRLHFHSLVNRRYMSRWLSRWSPTLRNSATGLLVGGMTFTAVLAANLVYASTAWSVLVLALLAMGYVAVYARMVRHVWCSPLAFLLVKPGRADLCPAK
jgi:UDP-N-acetylmuramyl pentapeptide phosphotransferase/UDP-N-acetylglucosamine-1-phosphate transferase